MRPSRRSLITAGAAVWTGMLAGCIGDPEPGGPADDPDAGDETDDDPADDDDADACDPIDLPLVDEPPHEPERPSQPDDIDGEWDEHYLGAGMATEPSRPFDRLALRFTEKLVDPVDLDGETVAYAALLTSREEFEERVEPVGDESTDRAADIDFEAEAVIAVFSGFGSSSVRHEWVRVEEACGELHLHGHYRRPLIGTDDVAPRVSGVVVERPAELDRAWVSVTTDEETRLNVATDQDVKVVEEEVEHYGPIEDVATVTVNREAAGDWHREDEDDTGVVVQLHGAEEVRSLVDRTDEVEAFLDVIDFSEDAVFYLESVAPDACHRSIELDEVTVVANDEYTVEGHAAVIDESGADVDCAAVVTYPAILVRIESEVALATGTFRIEDGWGNAERVQAIGLDAFARE